LSGVELAARNNFFAALGKAMGVPPDATSA